MENNDHSSDWYPSPDVMRDRDASDTIVSPDFLGSTLACDSPELRDTPDLVEGKPKFFRRRVATVLRKKLLKASSPYEMPIAKPIILYQPDTTKAGEGLLLESPGMSPITQAGSDCNFMLSQSSESFSQASTTKNGEPQRFMSTPTDANRALEEYHRGVILTNLFS